LPGGEVYRSVEDFLVLQSTSGDKPEFQNKATAMSHERSGPWEGTPQGHFEAVLPSLKAWQAFEAVMRNI